MNLGSVNLGNLNRAELVKAARRMGMTEAQLEIELRKNPKLVSRYGATHSVSSTSRREVVHA